MANNIDRRNKADSDAMVSFVQRIENIEKQKESEKGSFMKKCATLNEDIKAVLDEAKDAGIPKAALKAVIKVRNLERKVESAREALEDDDAVVFDDLRGALGDYADTPLGAAAVAKTEQDPTTAAIVAAVQNDEADKPDHSAERARDAAEFDRADAGKKAASVTALDPAAARRNRSRRSTDDVKSTADKYILTKDPKAATKTTF